MQTGFGENRASDQDLAEMFGRSHSVMADQRMRLQGILDAFLIGDLDAVKRFAAQIESDMVRVSHSFPVNPGRESEQCSAMAGIVTEAGALRNAADAAQYQPAYQHYANLTNRCISCHQIRRPWGTFEAPKELTTPAVGADGESKPSE